MSTNAVSIGGTFLVVGGIPAAGCPRKSADGNDTGIGGRDGTVGRLVEPGQGADAETEKDAIAYDAGAPGGGATAEELALHEIPER